MGGCRGCGNQLTGTYYEMTRAGASVIAAASDAVHREETMSPNRGSVGSGSVSIGSFDRPRRCDIKSSFYAAGRFC
jgi:hypothetical protein